MSAKRQPRSAATEPHGLGKPFVYKVLVEDCVTGLMRFTLHGGATTEAGALGEAANWSGAAGNGRYVQIWDVNRCRVAASAGRPVA